MQVALTDEERQLRDAVRAFAEARVRTAAAETDRQARFPRELVGELGRLGVLGGVVPERYGGADAGHVAGALAVEELSAACASTGAIVGAHTALVIWPILVGGRDAQRERYLPRLARGESLGCCVPEEAGVAVRRDGAHYVLDGHARAVVNGSEAALAVVFARGAERLAAFLVETTSPGWQPGSPAETTGLRGTGTAEVVLAALRLPRENLLGEEEDGPGMAAAARGAGAVATAVRAVGIARTALAHALAYARERRAFGQALVEFQGTQWRLADMATAVEAARLLALRAASLMDRRLPYTREAAMAEVFAAEAAMTVTTQAVQLHGGYGYTREFAVERCFRDATALAAHVADEPQRLAIGGALLREASLP